jgi:hypothetical protein
VYVRCSEGIVQYVYCSMLLQHGPTAISLQMKG